MAKEKKFGICLFCDKQKELRRSHTINRTFFSRLLKSCKDNNAAKVIKMSTNIIGNSNDNWTDHLLCDQCESYFNKHFDGYGANVLRGEISGQQIYEFGDLIIYKNIDPLKIIFFILSLYWRGAKSKHPSYSLLITSDEMHNFIKKSFETRELKFDYFNVKVSVIYDSLGAINKDTIKQFIVSPFNRLYENKKLFSVCFLFEGFFIELFFGKLTYSMKKKNQFLNPNSRIMRCEKLDFHDIKELHPLFSHMFKVEELMEKNNIPIK